MIRCFDLAGKSKSLRLSGPLRSESMEGSNKMVWIRGGASGFELGGDGGGVACERLSGERGMERPSGPE